MERREWVRQHEQRLGPLGYDGGERRSEILGAPHLRREEHQPVRRRRLLRLLRRYRLSWMRRVPEDGNAADSGRHLFQQLQTLGAQLREDVGEPGDVAARPREA